jgi:hypothetical protein
MIGDMVTWAWVGEGGGRDGDIRILLIVKLFRRYVVRRLSRRCFVWQQVYIFLSR